jgi:sarcosine oxidase gamma subunit
MNSLLLKGTTMKRISLLLAALVFSALAHSAPAGAATSTLTVTVQEQNGSGESGTATLTQVGGDVQVVIALKGAPATPQPAHIHTGTCSDLGGVVNPLTNVVGGNSTTLVKGTTIDALLAKPMAINVHMSADNLGKYVACGNIAAQ